MSAVYICLFIYLFSFELVASFIIGT